MNVNILTLEHFMGLDLPHYATEQSAGMDLRSANTDDIVLESKQWLAIPTGICLELPDGYEAQIRPRSGLAFKNGVTVLNSPGTIDADYRGEIKVILINHSGQPFVIKRGERVAQMVIAPYTQAKLTVVDSLGDTERGSGGFGSTGVK